MAANKKNLSHISAAQDTEGGKIEWQEHIGNKIPPVFTTVPSSAVKDADTTETTKQSLAHLLGEECQVTLLTSGNANPTGEVLIRTDKLSEDGANMLTKGCWMLTEPEPGEEAEIRGFFMHKGQTVGTVDRPTYTTRSDNAMEIRWDPRLKTMNDQAYPNKNTIYATIEKLEMSMYRDGVGLNNEELIDPGSGGGADEGDPNGIGKADFGAGWRRAQVRVLHAQTPAYIQMHEDDDYPPKLSHSTSLGGKGNQGANGGKGGKGESGNGRARTEMFALKLRFPTGYYKENAELVKKSAEILGIELRTDSHPYPQYAIRDALESFNKGQPMKDGQICNSRSLIKVNCIMAPECSGVTHPAELSAWLFSKCDTHYIAAAFTQELVTKGDAAAWSTTRIHCR